MNTQTEFKHMALLLPFKKKHGRVMYLLQRQNIPAWDNHPDVCGIAIYGGEDHLETNISAFVDNYFGEKFPDALVKPLGISAINRTSHTLCYLYAMDLSRYDVDTFDETDDDNVEHLFWADTEKLLSSLDSQLLACYAKVQYIML